MPARLIDGAAIAADVRRTVGDAAALLLVQHRIVPGLAAVLVGDDPASQVYVRSKSRACAAAGLRSSEHCLSADADTGAVLALIEQLNSDEAVDGILVQLPLPRHIDLRTVLAALDPAKDVDGFHPLNVGRLWNGVPGLVPCTPQGILKLLRASGTALAGASAVVLGRSRIVGRPVAALLLAADCTVTIAHSKSPNIAGLCRHADILVAAVGHPAFVKADWIKRGATVVDVGINRTPLPAGGVQLVGDVDFPAAVEIAGAITPVPGGVGPMTIACLLSNTLKAACLRRGIAVPAPLAD